MIRKIHIERRVALFEIRERTQKTILSVRIHKEIHQRILESPKEFSNCAQSFYFHQRIFDDSEYFMKVIPFFSYGFQILKDEPTIIINVSQSEGMNTENPKRGEDYAWIDLQLVLKMFISEHCIVSEKESDVMFG